MSHEDVAGGGVVPRLACNGVAIEILPQGVGRGSVHQCEAVSFHGERQVAEEVAGLVVQLLPVPSAGYACGSVEIVQRQSSDCPGVVVAADADGVERTETAHRCDRPRPVSDDISEAPDLIDRTGIPGCGENCIQRNDVAVNVTDDERTHVPDILPTKSQWHVLVVFSIRCGNWPRDGPRRRDNDDARDASRREHHCNMGAIRLWTNLRRPAGGRSAHAPLARARHVRDDARGQHAGDRHPAAGVLGEGGGRRTPGDAHGAGGQAPGGCPPRWSTAAWRTR